MTYIQDIEKALTERLAGLDAGKQKEILSFVREKILESYRNGIEAGRTGKQGGKRR